MPAFVRGGRESVDSCTMERSAEPELHGAAREKYVKRFKI